MQVDEARHSTLTILAAGRMWGRGAGAVHRKRCLGRPDAAYPQTPCGFVTGLRLGPFGPDLIGTGGPASRASEGRDNLRPDRNHAQKQRQRGERSSFFNDGPDHVQLPTR